MAAFDSFKSDMKAAYVALDAALRSVSLCAHAMENDTTDRAISAYDSALRTEDAARREIGRIHDAEMAARDAAAGLTFKRSAE